MKKNFQKWHNQKTRIHESEKRPGFHEREIWWCALGVNVGFEQDGGGRDFLRPVLVFKKFNKEIFWGIPLTQTKKNTSFYFRFDISQFDANGKELGKIPSAAILSQIRLIDASRLSHKLGDIVSVDFESLTKKFKALLP